MSDELGGHATAPPDTSGLTNAGELSVDDLRSLVDAQARIVELLTSRAPVETTLVAIAHELERVWEGSDIGFLMTDEEAGRNSTTALDLPHRLAASIRALPPTSLEAAVNDEDPFAPIPFVSVLDLEPGSSPAAEFAAALDEADLHSVWLSLVTPIDDSTPSWMVAFAVDNSALDDGQNALIRRFAHLARLAIDQHRAELQLHRLIADERRRLAGVIHDDPIQALTAVGLRVQRLSRHVDGHVAEQIRELNGSVAMAIERMRRLLIDLHPPTLDDDGLVSAIDVYLGEVLEPLGLVCSLVDDVDVEPALETASLAYRLAVEALWNVAKHAQATTVDVAVTIESGSVQIKITDDGIGFDASSVRRSRAGHLGISACRELAARASGSWTVETAAGEGTTVTLWLPGAAPIDAGESLPEKSH